MADLFKMPSYFKFERNYAHPHSKSMWNNSEFRAHEFCIFDGCHMVGKDVDQGWKLSDFSFFFFFQMPG